MMIRHMLIESYEELSTTSQFGPLEGLLGTWIGEGLDVAPTPNGTLETVYIEEADFVAIPPVSNGPQAVYGVRYLTRLSKKSDLSPMHQETGYWLWMPEQETIVRQFSIPRGILMMAGGCAHADDTRFKVAASKGSPTFGILNSPFLDQAAPTILFECSIAITGNAFKYDEASLLNFGGQEFQHTDSATLRKYA